jgi:hypothetical protein
LSDKDPSWIHQREQSAAASRDSAKDIAALYRGLKENGLSPLEAALLGGVYQAHVIVEIWLHGQKEEDG